MQATCHGRGTRLGTDRAGTTDGVCLGSIGKDGFPYVRSGIMFNTAMPSGMKIRDMGFVGYEECLGRMQSFTVARAPGTPDEIWLLEHSAVYTLGYAGDSRHLTRDIGIPLVQSDRGGQITYHGPGQVIAYVLVDLRRIGCGPRAVIECLERSVVNLLARHGIEGQGDRRRPGVYVAGRKIAAVGLRVKRGCCYHGVSLNVDMDLTPFGWIHPCGHPDLEVVSLASLGIRLSVNDVKTELAEYLQAQFRRLAG